MEEIIIPRRITCPECGGDAHLLQEPDPELVEWSTIHAYRCADCMDRFDLDFGEIDDD